MVESYYKKAVLSMDVEEWYHLDYINLTSFSEIKDSFSNKDGIINFLKILSEYNLKANFFIVGELIKPLKDEIIQIAKLGHEVGLHSFLHRRPINLSNEEFIEDVQFNINALKEMNITPIGYRAPCFALGGVHLNNLMENFRELRFDSSYIDQNEHPLYSPINLSSLNFKERNKGVFVSNSGFHEFEMTTIKFLGLNIPISGGGYLRILPWFFYKFLLEQHLKTGQFYAFYIHPFELSSNSPLFSSNVSFLNKLRFHYNRKKTIMRIKRTIRLLKKYDYSFHTFSELIEE